MSATAGGGSSYSASQGSALTGPGSGMTMFRWLEVLEKEFDKAFVDVDLLLGEIDPDQADITYEGRQKMTSLSSCFAQLCHKAQTIFQLNHKLEVMVGAELLYFIHCLIRIDEMTKEVVMGKVKPPELLNPLNRLVRKKIH